MSSLYYADWVLLWAHNQKKKSNNKDTCNGKGEGNMRDMQILFLSLHFARPYFIHVWELSIPQNLFDLG